MRKLHKEHEKAKRSGRTHSELMHMSVAEIADVSLTGCELELPPHS